MISRVLLTFFVVVVAAAGVASAEEWPHRPVRIVVPYPAGGSTDVAARPLAEYLARALGQQFYVENKSGAAGIIGVEAAAKSAPDGYTILIAPDFVSSAPHIFKLSIDTQKDLVPVAQISRQPVALAVHPSLGVKTLAEFVSYVKAHPGLSFATSGVGSQQQIVAEWFAKLAAIKLQHVPYRGGGQAINDLIAGHVKVGSLGSSPLIPHYTAGTLRILAQSTAQRSPALPDVPTYQQAGYKQLVLDQWLGLFVPIGTPAEIVTRLNTEINKALADPAIRRILLQSAQEPVGGSAEAFTALVRGDFEKYRGLVKELNIKVN
jgi:tripartite-type tricarboxylate transporter receptor subunit TctC